MEIKLALFVNQIGYVLDGTKFAYATGLAGGESFELCSKADGAVVFTGQSNPPITDRVAGEPVCCLDFSSFKTAGTYFIRVTAKDGKTAQSEPVNIGTGLYDDIYFSILYYFYLSRCGQDTVDNKFNKWGHPACHATPAVIYGTDVKKEVNGGWHDAGDYGRYIVAASKAVMDLLMAYEAGNCERSAVTRHCKRSAVTRHCERSAAISFDILAEVRFELEWMLKMQRPDGGVFHKVSCYHFCGFINPQDEKDELVISPVSSTATADFAGCLAFASEFYKSSDPAFAKSLMNAALKAWKYLETHDDELFKNPPEITTGGYGDWSSADERYFACAALFLRTGDQTYVSRAMEIRNSIIDKPDNPDFPWINKWHEGFGWGMVAGYGTELFLRAKDKINDDSVVQTLTNSILSHADKLLDRVNKASFGTVLDKVHWGSCGHVCDDAHSLLVAYDLTGRTEYYEAAKKQIDYVLGCNPNNVCYVTGFGANTVKYPHHRPSATLGDAMPGMLSGGPCEGLYDAAAKEKLGPLNLPPLRCFIDDWASYSTNEIAIYWNSTLVYVASKLKLV
ncbi:MAG: glycoside hydrolase family 9 protein [Treponema sp.]|nr:glycoside hydrolase family 9 protein [Treponema sp.]